ncbi:unnamed protein product [Spirodela intermedia]|uniref:Ribulose bisphosphate carboxylase small subunit, chloroplastic n=1 Tax=Spirodela intermedia TaxID=51605 RepID=A0A7I8IWB1_SPIIN|nr:unnamed protein product [Spirodela intermedia]CAA6661298.1 unnamed protein product [Spirodela intermedia]
MVAPFNGLRSSAAFPVTRKANADLSTLPSNGGRVRCMQTLSYLPDLSVEALAKEVEYLIRNGWIPCIEISKEGFIYRENHSSPGYYDGRYWTMWKLPMFGCTDASQVIAEVEEAKKAYPNYFSRIIGFDNKRQVQCISFIAYKPRATKPPVQLGAIVPLLNFP